MGSLLRPTSEQPHLNKGSKMLLRFIAFILSFSSGAVGAWATSKQAIVEMHRRSLRVIAADRTAPPYAAMVWAVANNAAFEAARGSNHPELSYSVAFAEAVSAIKPQQRQLMVDWVAPRFVQANRSEQNEMRRAAEIAAKHVSLHLPQATAAAQPLIWGMNQPAGIWRPTGPGFLAPALPGWGRLPLFSAQTVSATIRGLFPPDYGSNLYVRELEEVYLLGGKDSQLRTPDQTQIAQFWVGGAGTVTPPGLWIDIALQRITSTPITFLDAALVMKTLSQALCDAGIAAWEIKYRDNTWRPVTAIHEDLGDTDWQPLVTTPPFPGYVSGHSTFSAAAAGVLELLVPLTGEPLVIRSADLPGVTRSYPSYRNASEEAGMSRIFGGIHFQADNYDGLALGQRVACRLIEREFGHRCTMTY